MPVDTMVSSETDKTLDEQIEELSGRIANHDQWLDSRKGEMLTGLATKHKTHRLQERHELQVQLAGLRGERPPDYPRELATKVPQGERIERLEKAVYEIKETLTQLLNPEKRGPGRPRKLAPDE